eukprot:TRINITY_DN7850_c0_g1_i1.p1 TRINITY_DN7850_c0_g1~~TRINITY_DN7850_c0_g1_i1.p1  ORF type:complete len:335 (+),score=44.67 TRINITY_DN7850_c0_g1_i1:24-1007(+)
MKILVTGGAGFIGGNTAEVLLKRGDTVVIVDELNDYYDPSIKNENLHRLSEYSERVSFHQRDICDRAFLAELFEKEQFDAVCHLAARAGVRPSITDPLLYVHSNVEGTVALLETSAKQKKPIKNFVFASSSSVYGANLKAPFSEDDEVNNPVSPYAATKRCCELLAWTYHDLYKMPISALRFFTVYGPRGRPDMAPYKFMDSIYRGVPIQQFGDGTSQRDYTFIEDIVQGVIGAIDTPRPFEIYNLARGETISLKGFIALIEELVGKKAIIQQCDFQKGDVMLTYGDVSKAKQLIGYNPQYSIRDGMKKTVEWYIQRQNANNQDQPK